MSTNHSKAVVVAFANEKGGVGKTSLTAIFLAILSMLGYNVLGIDMDPQAHLSLLWGYHRDTITEGIYEILLRYVPKQLREQVPIKRVVKPTYYETTGKIFDPRVLSREQLNAIVFELSQGQLSGEDWQDIEKQLRKVQPQEAPSETLDALIADATNGAFLWDDWNALEQNMKSVVQEALKNRIDAAKRGPDIIPITSDASNADYAIKAKHQYWGEQLRTALRPIADQYEYIFIDCPPSIQVLTINALNAAKYVVIPLTPETLNLEGMLGLLGVIEQAQEQANPDLQTAGIMLNKVQSTWNIHQDMSRDLRTWSTNYPVFETEIKQNSAVVTSMGNHSLLVLDQPENEHARTYWYMLRDLLSVIGGPAYADVAEIVTPMKEEDTARKKADEQKRQIKRQRKNQNGTSQIVSPQK